MALIQLTPPTAEPLTVDTVEAVFRIDETDATAQLVQAELSAMITAARQRVENYTHRAVMTQTWRYLRDGWPGFNPAYNHVGYPFFYIPKPPFQSISSFKYIDVGGVVQTFEAPPAPYAGPPPNTAGYQLDPGGDTEPARVMPPFARPWPPTRMIPNNIILEFVCGYADVTVNILSIRRSSGIVTVTTDSPCLGQLGGDVTIAGVAGSTTDFNGLFTIAVDPARTFTYKQAGTDETATDVTHATVTAAASGVPTPIKQAMLLEIGFFNENREGSRWMPPGGGVQSSEDMTDTSRALLADYRCLIV